MFTLGDLWEGITGTRPPAAAHAPITRVVVDSRQVVQDAVFVALAGERTDGHQYIGEALARGAIAVIAEARARGDASSPTARPSNIPGDDASESGLGGNLTLIDVAGLQPSPAPDANQLKPPFIFIVESSLGTLQQAAKHWRGKFKNLKTVGVTGSVGKSSTKELVYAVLKQKFVTLKTEGNLNSETGLPITLFNLTERHQRAVLEMGMYALGEINALCEIAQPGIGVVTNVGASHIERLGSIENIARAKAELVEALPADGYAILNGDDSRVRAMREVSRAPVLYYGLDPTNDLWADEIESYGLDGIEFAMHYVGKHLHVHVPLLGRHSVHTALAAAAVGLVENLAWQEILNGLQDVSAQLRLFAVPGQQGVTLLDDSYNASPQSTLAALNLLSELNGRKIVVLGDMLELGTYEREGHHMVGLRAAGIADTVIAVGARGRMIGEAAQEAGHARVYFVPDNTSAVEQVRDLARHGDVILVKGSRGAHMEEIVTALALNASESGGSAH